MNVQYRKELLDLALNCGAVITGKPDGSEAITVLFSIDAWRAFDAATIPTNSDAAIASTQLEKK